MAISKLVLIEHDTETRPHWDGRSESGHLKMKITVELQNYEPS